MRYAAKENCKMDGWVGKEIGSKRKLKNGYVGRWGMRYVAQKNCKMNGWVGEL
jgi:hypothetical protein